MDFFVVDFEEGTTDQIAGIGTGGDDIDNVLEGPWDDPFIIVGIADHGEGLAAACLTIGRIVTNSYHHRYACH